MNKNKQRHSIKEYIATVIVSLFIVTVICFTVQIELLFRCEKTVNFNELNVENLVKFCTIEELEKQLAKTPDDIIVNIRLAYMYESLGKLDKANDFYKNALKLSSRSDFALYSYAMFCAKHDLFAIAATLAEELSSNSKEANYYKALIYEQIADSLALKGNYPASSKSFQVAHKYAKSVNKKKFLKQIEAKYADALVNLADYNMNLKEYEEAMANLKNSLKIKETAIANYKLGLIYNPHDLKNAEKHINSAFWEDPYLINPYIYNQILNKLLDESKILNQKGLYAFYDTRLSRFKNKLSQVYLYKDEVAIENGIIMVKKKTFSKPKHFLSFELQNKTNNDIKNLFVKAELYVNGKKYELEKKVINIANPLGAYDVLKYDEMFLDDNIEFNNLKQNNDIFVRFFAKKREDAPWVLIGIDFPKL